MTLQVQSATREPASARLLPLAHQLTVVNGVPGLFFTHLKFPSGTQELVNIDTGSVGIVIPQRLVLDANQQYLPWATPTGESMEITYEPSGDTISGPIVTLSGLTLGDGSVRLGDVKVLAYTQGSGTYMLGVGFGLEAKSKYLTAPQGGGSVATPQLDNPFLNIEGMGRDPGSPFQAAYTLSAAGGAGESAGSVTFGQTPSSTAGFTFLPVKADPLAPSGFQLPWVDVTVTPRGAQPLPTTRAQLLMDAGIASMFLGVFQPSPPTEGAATRIPVEWPGARIQVFAADSQGNTALEYGFFDANPQLDRDKAQFWNTDSNQRASPSSVMVGGPSPQGGSFINTGVHLLALYDYHFDAVNSRVGFRRRNDAPQDEAIDVVAVLES